jgi:thiamine kinase-like enzyme
MRELDERIERAVGSPPVRYEQRPGGYSTADRFAVTLADGRSVFVKSAEAPHLAAWLRREHEVYAALAGSFIPALEGWDDDGVRPVLAIEDLSDADWTPRWDAARVAAVVEALEELAGTPPPPNTSSVRESFAELFDRWRVVESDPAAFLSVGLRDAAWLDRALPVILAAVDAAPVSGDRVCHLDVRSDNLCFRHGHAVLVDWNWTSLANPALDLAAWAPSVRIEGGPQPWEVLPGAGELAAWIAGVWAAVVGLPPPETAPTVRDVQRRQLAVALDWIDRDLL